MFVLLKGDPNEVTFPLHNQMLIYHVPVIQKDDMEFYSIACVQRQPLIDVIDFIRKNKKEYPVFEILGFKKGKLDSVYLPQLFPKLSYMQKKAVLLAVANGYYDYPSKVSLDKLAKAMKISKSTFHEHLRRAEKKMMQLLAEYK